VTAVDLRAHTLDALAARAERAFEVEYPGGVVRRLTFRRMALPADLRALSGECRFCGVPTLVLFDTGVVPAPQLLCTPRHAHPRFDPPPDLDVPVLRRPSQDLSQREAARRAGCRRPDKQAWGTREAAYEVLRSMRAAGADRSEHLHIYECGCGSFHLGDARTAPPAGGAR
jgi:hypothetical protein